MTAPDGRRDRREPRLAVELRDEPLRRDDPVALLDPVAEDAEGNARRTERHRDPPGAAETVSGRLRALDRERVRVGLRELQRDPARAFRAEEDEDLPADLDDDVVLPWAVLAVSGNESAKSRSFSRASATEPDDTAGRGHADRLDCREALTTLSTVEVD